MISRGKPNELENTHHEERKSLTQRPLVAIGLPVFNGENHLHEAIESLLNQSFTDFELIISDNASTDATPEIIKKFAEQDSRIRYVRQPENIGASQNYQYVLERAESELFMWAAHDDVWADNWLEILTKQISPEHIGIRGRLLLIQEAHVVADKILPSFRKGDFVRCFLGNETNYRNHYVYSLFNRKKLIGFRVEAYKSYYYPDAIFVYDLLGKGALHTSPDSYQIYRMHDQNMGLEYSQRWKTWNKYVYRVHPLSYYLDYIRHSKKITTKCTILILTPIKHLYAQGSLWVRGFREIASKIISK